MGPCEAPCRPPRDALGTPNPGPSPPGPTCRCHLGGCGGSLWPRSISFPPSRAASWLWLGGFFVRFRSSSGVRGSPPNPPPHGGDPRSRSGGLWPGFVSPRGGRGWRRGGHLGCADGARAQPPIPQTFVWQCCGSWQGPLAPCCPPVLPLPPGHPVPLPEAPTPTSCRGSSRGAADAELPKSRF